MDRDKNLHQGREVVRVKVRQEQGLEITVPGGVVSRIGAALVRWRRLNNIKQSAIALHFGVTQATVCRWERGEISPSAPHKRELLELLTATPTSAQDKALLTLVTDAPRPMHLVCDLTHRLLACSASRVARWHRPAPDLFGRSLWRFAPPELIELERLLPELGWLEPLPAALRVRTAGADYSELSIPAGERQLTRFELSDGRSARLVIDL